MFTFHRIEKIQECGLMNFFSFIRSGNKSQGFPENDIEYNLYRTCNGQMENWSFFYDLSRADLIVVTNKRVKNDSISSDHENDLELLVLNDDTIAVFTSENRIFDNGIVQKKLPYVRISGRDIFSISRGMDVILNPFSDSKKLICANEIAQIV